MNVFVLLHFVVASACSQSKSKYASDQTKERKKKTPILISKRLHCSHLLLTRSGVGKKTNYSLAG